MKWTKKYFHKIFAVVPHKCKECDCVFWLEPMWLYSQDSYGFPDYYCMECGEVERAYHAKVSKALSRQKEGDAGSPPILTDTIKRKVAAAIWNGGYGWGNGSSRTSKLNEVFGGGNGIQSMVNSGVGRYDSAPGGEYTYANMRKKFLGYASGTEEGEKNE